MTLERHWDILMKIDLDTVRRRFDGLITGEDDRHEASNWARMLREADDRRELVVQPESDRRVVWKAIQFLEMYDVKTSPSEYLYGEIDLIANRPS